MMGCNSEKTLNTNIKFNQWLNFIILSSFYWGFDNQNIKRLLASNQWGKKRKISSAISTVG